MRKPDWCESRVDIPSYPASLYLMASRQMMYVDIKFPHMGPDFRRAAAGFALASTSRRRGILDIAQYLHIAASNFALMLDNGKPHVYARGSFEPTNCMPSEDLHAICAEYACAADGLALPTRFGE